MSERAKSKRVKEQRGNEQKSEFPTLRPVLIGSNCGLVERSRLPRSVFGSSSTLSTCRIPLKTGVEGLDGSVIFYFLYGHFLYRSKKYLSNLMRP